MSTEKPPAVSEEDRKEAERVLQYDDSRPTATLPGSHGTVTGTAVNDWLDDDGNPIYDQSEPDQ